MAGQSRVIGSQDIVAWSRTGRNVLEVLEGDIVTDLARETAERMNIRLVDGPLERPGVARMDGARSMMRGLYRRSPRWIAPQKAATASKPRRISRLGLVGAGGVGANIAHLAANADMVDEIALCDIVPGLAASIALDLNHASGINRTRARCVGDVDFSVLKDSEIVIVTAGRPRTPGMDRADLISINARVIHAAAEAIKAHAPEAIVIVVTNPLDEMTVEMLRATGFARERVLGMAGTLDSSRFRNALAMAASVSPLDVEALTLGSHGNEMAPIVSRARIRGRPVGDFLCEDEIEKCVKDAITGGGQVVALKKTGSATLAPAHAAIELVDHIRGARAGMVPVSVMLEGEYGMEGVVLGVPCLLSASGVLEVVELALPDHELAMLKQAAEAIRSRLAGE